MKYLLCLLMFAAGAFLAFGSRQEEEFVNPHVPDLSWDDIRAIYRRRTTLREQWGSARRFHDCLAGIKCDLWRRRLTLAAAADALSEASIREGRDRFVPNPAEEKLPLRERMALLLLRHLREDAPAWASPSERQTLQDEMRCELASWPGVQQATLAILADEDVWFAEAQTYKALAP